MVIILVVLMFVGFGLVGAWRQRVLETRLAQAAQAAPGDLRFHPGHAWLAAVGPGLVKIGFDELAASLVGIPDRIILPPVGTILKQGTSAMEVERGARRLSVSAPVTGRVVAVNEETADRPATVSKDPYGRGWTLVVRPRREDGGGNLLEGGAARQWLDALRNGVARMVSPSVVTAYDAGPLRSGFGEDLSDERFEELKRAFFTHTN
jgi:glycine cleavage system H lipoate-binding protein